MERVGVRKLVGQGKDQGIANQLLVWTKQNQLGENLLNCLPVKLNIFQVMGKKKDIKITSFLPLLPDSASLTHSQLLSLLSKQGRGIGKWGFAVRSYWFLSAPFTHDPFSLLWHFLASVNTHKEVSNHGGFPGNTFPLPLVCKTIFTFNVWTLGIC